LTDYLEYRWYVDGDRCLSARVATLAKEDKIKRDKIGIQAAARCTIQAGSSFTRFDAAQNLPKTNPFLRKLFQYIAGYDLDDHIAWLVDDLAPVLAQADMEAVLKDFGKPRFAIRCTKI